MTNTFSYPRNGYFTEAAPTAFIPSIPCQTTGLYLGQGDEEHSIGLTAKLLLREHPRASHTGIDWVLVDPDTPLHEELTIWQYLDCVCALGAVPEGERQLQKVLQQSLLSHLATHRIATLTPFHRQLVRICQALLLNPALLVLKEPFKGLARNYRDAMQVVIAQLSRNCPVLLYSSDPEDLAECQRLLVVHRGHTLYDGAPEDLVLRAAGHVGEVKGRRAAKDFSRQQILGQTRGVATVVWRVAAQRLPGSATPVPPTLEDACRYLLCEYQANPLAS